MVSPCRSGQGDRARVSHAIGVRGRAHALPAAIAAHRLRDRRVVARLLAVLIGDGRVHVAVGGQGVGAGLGEVRVIGRVSLDERRRGVVAVAGDRASR